jgi:hypothetical protein
MSFFFFFSRALASSYRFNKVRLSSFCICRVHWAGGPALTRSGETSWSVPSLGGVPFPGELAGIGSGPSCPPRSGEMARRSRVSQSPWSTSGWRSALVGRPSFATSCCSFAGEIAGGEGRWTALSLCRPGSAGSSSSGMAGKICFWTSGVCFGGSGAMTGRGSGGWGAAGNGAGAGSIAGCTSGSCCTGRFTGGCNWGRFVIGCGKGTL